MPPSYGCSTMPPFEQATNAQTTDAAHQFRMVGSWALVRPLASPPSGRPV